MCYSHVSYTCFFALVLTTILTISTYIWLLKGVFTNLPSGNLFWGRKMNKKFFPFPHCQKNNARSQVRFYQLMKVSILCVCCKMIIYPIPLTINNNTLNVFVAYYANQFLLRWPNTVFARALADAIQRMHKDCKNKHAVDTVIILFAQYPLYLCYFPL